MSGVKRRRLPGGLTANRLIPNALTLLALCAGVTAIRLHDPRGAKHDG